MAPYNKTPHSQPWEGDGQGWYEGSQEASPVSVYETNQAAQKHAQLYTPASASVPAGALGTSTGTVTDTVIYSRERKEQKLRQISQ